MDKRALYHITRRNSHIHAAVDDNYKRTGAVLLTKLDCMDFAQYKGYDGVDMFPLDVTVTNFDYKGVELDIELSVYFIYSGFSLRGKQHDAKFLYI